MIALSPRGRSLLRVAQVALALGLILLLLRAASPEQIWSLRHRISYGYWLWAVVLLLAMHGLGAASILVLLTMGPGAPRGRLVLAYGHVQALALFTPAQAAEALLPLLYSRAGIEAGETAASLLVQRLVTLGPWWRPRCCSRRTGCHPGPCRWWRCWPRRVAGGDAGRPVAVRPASVSPGGWLPGQRASGRWTTAAQPARRAGQTRIADDCPLRGRHRRLLGHVRLFRRGHLVHRGGGSSAVVTLAALLPLSPGGLGVTEGIFVAALRPRGFEVEQILGAALAGRVLTIALLGAFTLIYSATSWKEPVEP